MASLQHEVAPAQRQFTNEDVLRRQLGATRQVTVNTTEFVRTRDALISSYMNLSQSIDDAVKAYLNHTNVIIHGDGGALNATLLIEPFNKITQTAQQVAQQALHAQGNDSIDPQLLQNGHAAQAGQNGAGEEKKKKRTKRAYKQRDPNAPKRPLTAYFRYLGEMRPSIMEEVKKDPSKFEEAGKPGDISKIATRRWNNLTEAQQAPYKQAYRDALGDYEENVKEYKKASGKDVDDNKVEIDGAGVDPELDVDAKDDVGAGGEKEDDSSDSESSKSDEDSDASGESDDEVDVKPAPPPPAKKAAVAQTPKSALKKGAKQAQTFTSIPEPPTPAPVQEKAASPAKKRKAAAEPEDTSKSSKKKSRKSTVTAGADPVPSPAPAPVATTESSPPATSDKASKKAKKDKKKRKGSVEA